MTVPCAAPDASYVSNETGEPVRLHGTDVARFLAGFSRLEDELVSRLWREGVI